MTASLLSSPLFTHLFTYIPSLFSPLSKPSLISLRPFIFFLSTPDIHIHTYTALQAISLERAKGYWRGLNPDEYIEAALSNGLFKDKSGIDSNPIRRKLNKNPQLTIVRRNMGFLGSVCC